MLRALFSKILHKKSWPVCLKWQLFTVRTEPQGSINLLYSVPICSITWLGGGERKSRELFTKQLLLVLQMEVLPFTMWKAHKQKPQENLSPPGQKRILLPQNFVSTNYFWCKSGGARMGLFFLNYAQRGIFYYFFKFDQAPEKCNSKHLHLCDKYLWRLFCELWDAHSLLSLRLQTQGLHI